MNSLQKKTFTILLIDDNVAHAFLTREILKESRIRNTVHKAKDAAEAFMYMLGKDALSGQIPDLILLDLGLPIMDGFEFLAEIRKDNRLKEIPVFVLSTSSATSDMEKSSTLGARAYFVKPLDIDHFEMEIRELFKVAEQD
jgi:CheY-like chemotaxis protein